MRDDIKIKSIITHCLNSIHVPKRFLTAEPKQDDEIIHKGVYLCGPSGCGKTHRTIAAIKAHFENLIWSIIREESNPESMWEKLNETMDNPGMLFISTMDLIVDLKRSFDAGTDVSEPQIIKRLISTPRLFLDDLGVEKPSDWTCQILYHIIDARYREELPITITSNIPLSGISDKLGDRTSRRIKEMCKIVNVG